ncbi:hypothetical protein [Actinomadura hibisca]|uniref:hypothetical protein n=1 Tax=Actinomadura hibisca TaxID=68565 RepID=UPI00082CC103|nr:hypothetical protein [Actinomadura hibisca]
MAAPSAAQGLGDKTMMVPPPTPSWAPAEPQGAEPQGSGQQGSGPLSPAPQGTGPMGTPPPAQLNGAPADPESTAAWVFEPDADDEPAPPTASATPGAADATQIAPPPAWAEQPHAGTPGSESIVPDSWYAKPRKPEPEAAAPPTWNEAPAAPAGWNEAPAAPPSWNEAPAAPSNWNEPPAAQPQPNTPAPTQMDWNAQPAAPQWGATAVLGANGPATQAMDQGPQGFGPPQQPPPGGQGPFGGQFGEQGGYPAPAAPSPSGSKAGKPLVIGVCALVLVAVATVGMVMWPEGEEKKAPTASATDPAAAKETQNKKQDPAVAQAVQVNLLLNASSDTRRTLARSLTLTGKCQDLPQAISGFQEVATRRQNQLRRTAGLKLDKLQQGERMRAHLRQSFQASLQVDQSLLTWAQRNQRHCKGKPRPDAAKAPGRAPAEQRATLSKKRFVVLWNRVAKKTGQPTRQWNGW